MEDMDARGVHAILETAELRLRSARDMLHRADAGGFPPAGAELIDAIADAALHCALASAEVRRQTRENRARVLVSQAPGGSAA